MSAEERHSAAASTNAAQLDRREFIAAATAVAAVAALPLAASSRAAAPAAAPAAVPVPAAAPLADWTIDDMWGVHPRYAEPIGYPGPQAARDLQALVDTVDLPFLS